MSLFSLSQRTTASVVGTPIWEIRSGALKVNIAEIGLSLTGGAGPVSYGVGTPQAIGITPTAPQTFVAEDDSGATALSVAAVAWGTAPTQPLYFVRKFDNSAVGAGVILTFPRGFMISASASAVVWSVGVPVTCDVWAVIWE